jgi:hypothetical protein
MMDECLSISSNNLVGPLNKDTAVRVS